MYKCLQMCLKTHKHLQILNVHRFLCREKNPSGGEETGREETEGRDTTHKSVLRVR